MKKLTLLLTIYSLFSFSLSAQYHKLDRPQASPYVEEMQELGITQIKVKYSSPAVNGRNIWGGVVPMNGDPIPWRTGANINTIISFSTDVFIEGQPLPAGSYGFHTNPGEKEWELIFASNDNVWGSYYLDLENEVALKVTVPAVESSHQEMLDFNFMNRTDSSLQIAVEWEKVSVPFTISVDLNKTVVESLRYQLKGHTTNAWNAWTTAALWCLDHNTNLEEALQWATRSIEGGYGGYRATKNFTNLAAKARIELELGKTQEGEGTMKEALSYMSDGYDTYATGMAILRKGNTDLANQLFEAGSSKFPEAWFMNLGLARSHSVTGDFKSAKKSLETAMEAAPDSYKEFLSGEMKKLDNREKLI